MTKVFVTSDHHFSHPNIMRFVRKDGTPLRPFNSMQEMEEVMVARWNSVVSPEDKVYHLGDFAMGKKGVRVAAQLNGHKTLIMGNHDVFNTSEYLRYFDNCRAYRVLNLPDGGRVLLSHVPIHADCLGRFAFNIHGHLHENIMPDKRFISVCVEQTDFYPVELFSLVSRRQQECQQHLPLSNSIAKTN